MKAKVCLGVPTSCKCQCILLIIGEFTLKTFKQYILKKDSMLSLRSHVIGHVLEYLVLVDAFFFCWGHCITMNCSQYLPCSENHVSSIWTDKQHSGCERQKLQERVLIDTYPGRRRCSGRTVSSHQNRDQMAAHLACAACSHSRWPWKHPWCRNKSQTHSCPCDRGKTLACIHFSLSEVCKWQVCTKFGAVTCF